jgi:YgiT-type zinc finger domain-containing protein
MRCTTCGATLQSLKTDLPFKVTDKTIVILKQLPVLQCVNCSAYEIEDAIITRVEELLSAVDRATELEIIRFAA